MGKRWVEVGELKFWRSSVIQFLSTFKFRSQYFISIAIQTRTSRPGLESGQLEALQLADDYGWFSAFGDADSNSGALHGVTGSNTNGG